MAFFFFNIYIFHCSVWISEAAGCVSVICPGLCFLIGILFFSLLLKRVHSQLSSPSVAACWCDLYRMYICTFMHVGVFVCILDIRLIHTCTVIQNTDKFTRLCEHDKS